MYRVPSAGALALAVLTTACATPSQSILFGAGAGAVAGAVTGGILGYSRKRETGPQKSEEPRIAETNSEAADAQR